MPAIDAAAAFTASRVTTRELRFADDTVQTTAAGAGATFAAREWNTGRVIVGGGLTFTGDAGQWKNAVWQQVPGADGDVLEWPNVLLAAGAYTMRIIGTTGNSAAIQDWRLNGVLIPALTGLDWFSGPFVNNVIMSGAVIIAADGIQTLRSTVNGQNGASLGFDLFITDWWIE